jgi:hypothetical protein
MTDGLIAKAARENCFAFAREHFKPRDLLVVLGSLGVFILAVSRNGHWLWWIAAFPPAVYAALAVGWLAALWWLPRHSVAKLARLPSRSVSFELSDSNFAFVTALERWEVAWSELKALKRLPSFWLLCTRAGGKIPVPVGTLLPEHLSLIQSKMAETAVGAKTP